MKATLALLVFAAGSIVSNAASFSSIPTGDAFVTTGPGATLSTNNYGGGGAIALAAPGLAKGEFQSVLQFNLAGGLSSFNSTFGAGQWSIQSVTLQLTATVPGNPIFNTPGAGLFGISWMQNDSWTEGSGNPGVPGASGITFATLQNSFISPGDQNLGTFGFSGATNGSLSFTLGLTPGVSADVLSGDNLSLRLFAADSTVSGVFNSKSFGTASSRPQLTVFAVPEPGSLALGGLALVLFAVASFARRKNRRRAAA